MPKCKRLRRKQPSVVSSATLNNEHLDSYTIRQKVIDCSQRSSTTKIMETQQSLLNNVEDSDFEKRLATIVEILLNYDAHVNAETKTHETPLQFTVRRNCFKVAQLLVQRKSNVDVMDEDRKTLLHLCSEFSDSKMAELLLKHYELRPKPVNIQNAFIVNMMQIFSMDVNNQDFQTVKIVLKHCKKRADKMHDEFIDIFKAHLQYHRLIDEQSRQEFKEYKGSYDAGDSCSCLSFLKSAYNALIDKSRLIDWEQFWTFYQNYQKAECKYHTEHAKILLNELKDRIDRFMARCMKHTEGHVNEMMMSENNISPLHLEYESCFSSPIFNEFQLQLACALCLNNNDAAPMTDFKDETKENMVIDFFRLRLANDHCMSPFDHNSFNERNQSETLQIRENVKSYVNRKDNEGCDALLKAVEFIRPDVVQLLLKNGADTSSITSQGYSALHIAVSSINRVIKSSNPVEMIKVLLATGEFSVNALTFKAETPLHLATGNCGCMLSGQDSENSQCRKEMHNSVISLLLENKANVSRQDCEGMTPLMIASERGCCHIVKILLDWNFVKVDLDARDKYGETALIKAVRMHHTDIVEVLVNSGARVDLQDYRGFTALHAALHDPDEFRSLFELFENEPQDFEPRNNEVNERVYNRVKGAALARVRNSLNGERDEENYLKNSLITILLRKGLQFEILDFADNTAFDFLVDSEIQSSRSEEEAQQRLDKMRNENNVYKTTPCNLNRRWLNVKWRRESPLFWLAAVCIMIAEHKGIQPEKGEEIPRIKDYKGRTVLHYVAMSTGYEQLSDRNSLFKILLTLGCKIDAKDIYQRTPLHYLDVSSSNLLFGVAQQIGIESTEKRRLIFRDILKIKDLDDKTVDELRSLREGIAKRERLRTSEYYQAGKTVDLGTIRYDNGTMKINKKDTYDFETGISWSIWKTGIADYAHRNTITSCLTEAIHNFIKRLANAIERKEPWFKCQPMLVGSAFEGTKIDSPDEFDFDFILTKFSNLVEVIPLPVAPEGFVHLRKKPNVPLGETDEWFFDNEDFLKTNEINCRFKIILSQVFQDPSFWDEEHLFEPTDAEDKMKRFVRWYARYKNGRDHNDLTDQRINPGICTTIRLKQTRAIDGEYLPNDISLDLVPCIHVNGWWPDKARSDISDTLKANGCNLVFDQPQRKYLKVPFGENYARISFAPAESQMIKDSSPTAKATYMVCKHLIKDKPQMTYILKTCLLYCIEALDREDERSLGEESNYSSVTAEKLSLWVDKLMRCYLIFFLQDFCPCYLMPSFCLPIGEFLKSNHILLNVTDESDYEFLKEENKNYRCSVREVYTTNFDLFRRVCTRDTDIPIPKPQPLCESLSHNEFISQLRTCFV